MGVLEKKRNNITKVAGGINEIVGGCSEKISERIYL